jgi:hypothetical protein
MILGLLVVSAAFAGRMSPEDAKDKAESSCYFYNTACALGAEIGFNQNESQKKINDKIRTSIKSCSSEMDTDLRKISCLHGAQFFYSNLLGQNKRKKMAMKTIPFMVYTAGHALGVSISLLNYMANKTTYANTSKSDCELYSFDNDVLKRCHQGLTAFNNVL